MTAFLDIDMLLLLTNIGTLFAFVIVCAAVLVMRRTNPEAPRPFRCPFVPVVPVLGIGTCLLLMLSLPASNWWRLLAWMALGLCIYFIYGRRHSILGKELRGEISLHGVTPAGMLDGGPAMSAADGATDIQPARDKEGV
jgi:APA family basic amino acid/polyamine antiporter